MHIMTKRGWMPIQFKSNSVGVPTWTRRVDEEDVRKGKHPDAKFRSAIAGQEPGFFVDEPGEVPSFLEQHGIWPDQEIMAQQFVDALRDYREGRIDYDTCMARYHARKPIEGLAQKRASEKAISEAAANINAKRWGRR